MADKTEDRSKESGSDPGPEKKAPPSAKPAAAKPTDAVTAGKAAAGKPATASPAAGSPAAGAAKPAAKKPAKARAVVDKGLMTRRKMVWISVFGVIGIWGLATLRFFFPRVLFEPKTKFKIGFPSDYGIGVDTKYQQAQRIWVVRDPSGLYVIFAKCTHLGCTPDWKEGENKFKCPCHGSGFDSEGVNFEGPAPRPMDRAHVQLDAEGQVVVDKARLYGPEDWKEPGAFIAV